MDIPIVVAAGFLFIALLLNIVSLNTAWYVYSLSGGSYYSYYVTSVEECLSSYGCSSESYSSLTNIAGYENLKAGGAVVIFLLAIALVLLLAGTIMFLIHGLESEIGRWIPRRVQYETERFYMFVPIVAISPQLLSIIMWAAVFPYAIFSGGGINPSIGAGIAVLFPAVILCIIAYTIAYIRNLQSSSKNVHTAS